MVHIATTILVGVVLGVLLLNPTAPFEHEPVGVQLAHASPGSNDGCASCHSAPLSTDCISCHPSPPTTISGASGSRIDFPHHSPERGGPPDNCQASNCHDGNDGDARYAKALTATHSYCDNCHGIPTPAHS